MSARDRMSASSYGGIELSRRITVNALIVCITVLLTLAALEAVVRLGGETDAGGQFAFMGYALEPYATPVEQLRPKLEAYIENQETITYDYDKWLGWVYRPNSTRQSGTFAINSAGFRSRREYSQAPPPDTLRIALFGDSFTAGDEVSDDETWGHYLELELNRGGIRAEVLNFGVGGYGMGQAFLRWRHQGRHYRPDMVIFGFQPENLNRNVNIFRLLYRPLFSFPFSKPRFVLTESEGLALVNSPTIPVEQIMTVYESFKRHPLAEHEYYYQSREAASSWWSFSRLAAFLYAVLMPKDDDGEDDYGPASERGMLGKAIVDAFAADVIKRGADFFAVYLPRKKHVRDFHKGAPHPYQFLLDHFAATYPYITFEDQIDDSHGWAEGGHYGPEINSIVAQAAAGEIQSCIESGACELTRFEDRSAIFTSAS